ncbi:hypothetical protein Pth03_46400 [Planotetraspora thailandica]|uniref:Uncharacterized protein n=1 Tax=Planotetraspora thailandica TaxID=487172 RepID=A0A8J3V7B3_9ACTN|nr:hypothetical protein Pth03_46400 [Planotetraspora thailandica]
MGVAKTSVWHTGLPASSTQGRVVTGWGAMSKSEDEARDLIATMKEQESADLG